MKKGFLLLMILVLAFTVIACSTGNDDATSEQAETTQTEDSNANDSSAAVEEKVELTLTSWRTEDAEAWKVINAQFSEQYPNIQVTFSPIKNTEYDSVLQAQLASKSAADVIMVRPFDAGKRLFDSGNLIELNTDVLPNLKDFSKDVTVTFTTDEGQIYAAPEGLVYVGLLYNKKIFRDNGINVPETWDEFYQAMDVLKSKGITPIAAGAKDAWVLEELLSGPFLAGYLNVIEFKDQLSKKQTDFLNPGFVKHLENLNKMKDYFPQGYEGVGYVESQQLFVNEQAAVYTSGSFETYFLKQTNPNLEFGALPSLKVNKEDKQYINGAVSFGYGINKDSKNIEAAKTYVNWLISKEGAQALGDNVSGFYVRHPEVTGVSDEQASEWLTFVEVDNVMPTWTAQYLKRQQPDAGTLTSEAISKMWSGEFTPQQAAQHIQDGLKWYFDGLK
jgi:raffinose/stachyose/melibiose transport system substrate-binding protein